MIAELGRRTAQEALDAGVPPKQVWGAVWRALELPPSETMTTTAAGTDVALVQRRTVRVLVLAQAFGALGITIGIATASLLARDLSGSESLAGLAQTAQVLGAAVASYLLARVMSRTGRRIGLATGYLVGGAGGSARGGRRRRRVDAAAAGRRRAARLGHGGQLRRAVRRHRPRARGAPRAGAVDRGLGDHDRRGRRPQPHRPVRGRLADRLDIPELTGPFAIGAAGMLLAALVVGVLLRPDPLLVAREVAGKPAVEPTGTSWDRARAAVRERPVLGFAVAGLAAAHAVMIGVMVMTPLHMEHGGAELRGDRHRDQRPRARHVRVLAAGRHARRPVRAASGCSRPAAAILLLSLLLCAWAPEGAHWQIFVGLFLLGLGWSFATVVRLDDGRRPRAARRPAPTCRAPPTW